MAVLAEVKLRQEEALRGVGDADGGHHGEGGGLVHGASGRSEIGVVLSSKSYG